MSLSSELAALYQRDLTRLLQQVQAFPTDDSLWAVAPGITNSAGNLALHLEGNLREFVGRQLGGVPYERKRDEEFHSRGLAKAELLTRVTEICTLVPRVIESLSVQQLEAVYPQVVLGKPITTQQFLIHLSGHLNYHLGQIDYLRRMQTEAGAINYAGFA